MENCDHVYCLDCIRKWRSGNDTFDNRIVKACPECRVTSDFVIPSRFWYDSAPEKRRIIDGYKQRLSETPCAYFKQGAGECPFADRCFYKHVLPDGTRARLGEPTRFFDASGHVVRSSRYTFDLLFEGFDGNRLAGRIEDPDSFIEAMREMYLMRQANRDVQ
ncbi:hypothetical protein ACOME3_002460 [Neoechinorhynchus agilis]